MHFIDQGWQQVNLTSVAHQVREPSLANAATVSQGPSMHAFTPRVRAVVQCARIHNRLKLSELAKRVELPVEYLRDIEEGATFPSSTVIEALQTALGVQLLPQAEL